MAMIWRLLRRLIFLFVTLVIASNTIAYVILNNTFVHEWFRKELNQRVFQDRGLEIAIGPIYVNFLETKLNFRELDIHKVARPNNSLARVDQLTIGFDPLTLSGSWHPAIKYIEVGKWMVDLSIVDFFSREKSESTEKSADFREILKSIRLMVGRQIEFADGQLVRSVGSGPRLDIKVKSLFAKFDGEKSNEQITGLIELDKSSFCANTTEPCATLFPIDHALLTLVINADRLLRVEKLEVQGLYGAWSASGDIELARNYSIAQYNLNIEGITQATPWFALGRMSGSGQLNAKLMVRPLKSEASSKGEDLLSIEPSISGKVDWKNLTLSGYDIYSGTADVQFSRQLIQYRNAQIQTPRGAVIESRGEYYLHGRIPFSNSARIKNMPFTELMAGLTAPTNAVDFQMTTNELNVYGELNSGTVNGYTLVVAGPVRVTQFVVPEFEPNKRKLPSCDVQLRLESNGKRMTFEGTSARCDPRTENGQEPRMQLSLQKGKIDYQRDSTEFKFTTTNAAAELISYFVDEPIQGALALRGEISSSAKQPLLFKAAAQVSDGSVHGLRFSRVSGEVELDTLGFRARGVEAWLDDEAQSANLKANGVKIDFNSHRIEIDGMFDGRVSHILSAFGGKYVEMAKEIRGHLQVPRLRVVGNMRDLRKASVDLNLKLTDFSSPNISAREIKAGLVCQQGWCSGSRLFAEDLVLGKGHLLFNNNKKKTGKNLEILQSKAIVEIESISEKSLSLRADIQSVPFAFVGESKDVLAGAFDLRGSAQGGWKDWELSATGRLDGLSLRSNPLGSVVLTASSHGGGPLNVFFSGLFDQVQGRVVFDHRLEESTTLFASLRAFELFKYIPAFNSGQIRATGDVSADVSLEGPGLRRIASTGSAVASEFSGQGQVSKLLFQSGKEMFSLRETVGISLVEGELKFSPVILKSAAGEIISSGSYSFEENKLSARVEGQVDANVLTRFGEIINQASGKIALRGQIQSADTGFSLRGEARVENVTVGGKYLSPPITALNGRVLFQDSRIEIPNLTGAKGTGQIDVVGTIDLTSGDESQPQDPSVAIRANLRSAQFRWPQDIFETVETSLDGQVELVGTKRPYALSGDVRIVKGRAYRDATCQEMLRPSASSSESSISNPAKPFAQLSIGLEADNSFTLQTSCIRGRVSSALKITGSDTEPVVAGQIRLDNGVLNLLKTRFEVTRADAIFDNLVRIEPRLDAQMVAKVDKYSVFVGAEGPLSRPRLNIWSDPSVGPDGNPLSRPTLIRMISTGRGPGETTQTAVTQAIANGVVGLFDDPLSQAVSKITRGFVDRFELQPILEGGQSSWRARVSRDLGEKFNLGLDFEPNSQSLTGTIFINESVNVIGGFDRRSSQIGTYSELSGGFRFQFGGK